MKLRPLQEKMGKDNQSTMDEIMSTCNGVFGALDNIEARLYIDNQCVNFQRPLFESGTQGNKGNTQPVIPEITESYSASKDPRIMILFQFVL